ncbi:MAG: hypothetical protein A2V66_07285 [Ignavibacteria bacterium RBG_13_36_8]|nr:MAG: hypothetical protein A2V66_07285 [Ignavibacteria bacterium RBG_13_36_8]
MPDLQIFCPKTLEEATSFLDEYTSKIKILAGGTDVIPGIQQNSSRFNDIHYLVDINKINELRSFQIQETELIIGAAVSFSDLYSNKLVKEHFPLLSKAAGTIGSNQIRNRATIGGNLVNNAPCADSVPPLLVYEAALVIASKDSTRKIRLSDFLLKPYKTQLKQNEIVSHIVLPIANKKWKGDFYKLGRRRGVAISRLTLAILVDVQNDIIKELRVASGAITPIGKRLGKIEESAKGQQADDNLFKELSLELGKQILKETGIRWSSPYKLPVVQQMFYQLLSNLCLKE